MIIQHFYLSLKLCMFLNIFSQKSQKESKSQAEWKWQKFNINRFLFILFIIFWQKSIDNKDLYRKRSETLIINIMARTKQTARMAVVRQAPKSKGVSKPWRYRPAVGLGSGKVGCMRTAQGQPMIDSDSDSQSQSLQVNTQQFSLKFDDQQKCQKQCVSGTMIKCKNCQAIFTSQSKLTLKKDYQKLKADKSLPDQKKQKFITNYDNVWICEFCLSHNNVPKNYNVPKQQNPCYLLEKAKKSKQKVEQNSANKILIFCIDISGSMDHQPEGKSRIESVKEAITDQVNRMKFQKEKIKIGIVKFGSSVSLVGDGKIFKQTVVSNTLYDNFDEIVKFVSKIDNFCQPIQKSHTTLKKVISELSTFGSTALGPGLLSSIQLASKGGVGSKVILCTDGQANVGLGGQMSADRFTFYEKAANYAKNKRVSVSILSLKGDRCNLKQLGKLSLASGGSLLKIDPSALGTQFSKIAKQQILGSNSKLIIKVNKIFEIVHHANQNELSGDKTTLTQDFGNFSKETQLTFQFSVLSKQQASKKPEIDLDIYKLDRVPMQIQLEYIGRDGSKYIQIVTDWRQLTQNQKQALQGANFGLFAASVLQRASQKIKNSQFKDADAILKGYWSLVKQKFQKTEKKEELDKFAQRIKKIQQVLTSKRNKAEGKVKKTKITAKKACKKKQISKPGKGLSGARGGRGGARGGARNRSRSLSSSDNSIDDDDQNDQMSSDSQQQALQKGMRARSRSRSVSPKNKGKKK